MPEDKNIFYKNEKYNTIKMLSITIIITTIFTYAFGLINTYVKMESAIINISNSSKSNNN